MFTETDYDALLDALAAAGDESYRAFNEALMPGVTGTLGVRVPRLRALARDIVRQDAAGFLAIARDDTHEERLLQGLVIAGMRCTEAERMERLRSFVPKIDNWAVCDIVCNSLKSAAKNREGYWVFLTPYLASEREFEVRFAVVLLLSHYIVGEWILRVLAALEAVSHPGYYVRMAVAWAVSVAFVKFRAETLPLFTENALDDETHDRAIRKCCESLRVSAADKALLRGYKRGRGKKSIEK